MDDRIFPGVLSTNERILSLSAKYLNIGELDRDSNKPDIAAWRRLCIILLQEFNKDMKFDVVAELVDRNHPMVSITNRRFRHLYHGEDSLYTYIHENVKSAVEGHSFFTIHDLIRDSADSFSIPEKHKDEGIMMLTSNKKADEGNLLIKIFVTYFQRHGASKAEIINFLNLPKIEGAFIVSVPNRKEYFEKIDNMIKLKLHNLNKSE